MFTSEPSLAQRIERMISVTPIVDPHTHIRCDEPNAPDLASLMSYHWVQTELRAVGMPKEDLAPALPPDERVRRAIPFVRRMRNTAMAWCLFRIFRDLYDFQDPHLTETNYRDLLDKVEKSGRDASWAATVLKNHCNIETVVTSLGNRSADSRKNPENVLYMLDAHYLFCPGVATDLLPFFGGRTNHGEYFTALSQVLDDQPSTSQRLRQRLFDWLDRTVSGPVRFSNTFIPIEQRFLEPDVAATDAVLRPRARQDAELSARRRSTRSSAS